jgi:N-acetylglutamate synthase-like GNAT family acetyltransferase
MEATYRLRRVESLTDWHAYHNIRRTELFAVHCPEVVYDSNHPDEHEPSNLPHVLELDGTIIGTIRIDLMGARCAAFRLIAIRKGLQRRGHGSRLLGLAEQLVSELGCAQVTIQSVKDAVPFYLRHGYTAGDWHDLVVPMSGTARLGKRLQIDRPPASDGTSASPAMSAPGA